jgi:UDP-GlcNAc:undecaprenyl-phosphate GlcNAc-1-phosphate transferase
MSFSITFFSAFAVSFLVVPVVISLAHNSGAIAHPGRRHFHSDPTPKFGGIAIASGVLLVSPFVFSIDRVIGSYIVSSALMLLLGVIDDVRGANWKVKLVFSIIATSIIIFGTGIWIKSLGNLFGLGEVYLGYWGIPFTYFAVFGVINAINLVDGLNGLACGISSIAFLAFAVFASHIGNDTVFYLSVANLGATLGLFYYNYPKARIFMGDSGSLFLGFSLAVLAIFITQGEQSIDPMVPVLVLGLPIFDTLRVMVTRVKNRRHPFHADKTHIHHLMMRSGVPLNRVVQKCWLLSALMASMAFVLHSFQSSIMLLVFCIILGLIGIFIQNLRIIKTTSTRK